MTLTNDNLALPRPILLCPSRFEFSIYLRLLRLRSDTRGYLVELLGRMTKHRAPRALPEELPEWRHHRKRDRSNTWGDNAWDPRRESLKIRHQAPRSTRSSLPSLPPASSDCPRGRGAGPGAARDPGRARCDPPVGALARAADRGADLHAEHVRPPGGNEGADASHFLYQDADDRNVALDLAGPGGALLHAVQPLARQPLALRGRWDDHLVRESSTADPDHPRPARPSCPRDLFPEPLALTWSATKGADLSWVPIPFETSFRLAYSRTHYGTGYYIYQQFVPGARLLEPDPRPGTSRRRPRRCPRAPARAGTDLVPRPDARGRSGSACKRRRARATWLRAKAVALERLAGSRANDPRPRAALPKEQPSRSAGLACGSPGTTAGAVGRCPRRPLLRRRARSTTATAASTW